MNNGKLSLRYEVYIAAAIKTVWEALTDGSVTKQYFYGCSVESEFKEGSAISYLGDASFNMLDGKVLAVEPLKLLRTSFRAHWDEKVSKDKASRVTWELSLAGQATKLTLLHDQFDGETATYQQSASGWNLILSSLKTYLETAKPLLVR